MCYTKKNMGTTSFILLLLSIIFQVTNHLALYRKYRPETFDHVVGQEQAVKVLTAAIKSKKIAALSKIWDSYESQHILVRKCCFIFVLHLK